MLSCIATNTLFSIIIRSPILLVRMMMQSSDCIYTACPCDNQTISIQKPLIHVPAMQQTSVYRLRFSDLVVTKFSMCAQCDSYCNQITIHITIHESPSTYTNNISACHVPRTNLSTEVFRFVVTMHAQWPHSISSFPCMHNDPIQNQVLNEQIFEQPENLCKLLTSTL